jgi:hypothetical protein
MATQKKNTAAEEAARKALEAVQAKKSAEKAAAKPAEKKKVEHTITQVGQQSTNKEELLAITKKNAMPYRIGAVVCWVLAIVCEIMAILVFVRTVQFGFTQENPGWWICWGAFLLLDLVFVIVGSQLWKKGNHLDPASAKNKTRFWLHNNLGIFVAALCFIPFIIIALLDKNADKKAKTWAAVIAAVALALGVTTSIDYNPISQEEMLNNAATYEKVYWLDKGEVFHAFDECQYVHGKELNTGSGEEAVKAGKTRICKVCEKKIQDGLVPDDMNEKEWTDLLNSAAQAASGAASGAAAD